MFLTELLEVIKSLDAAGNLEHSLIILLTAPCVLVFGFAFKSFGLVSGSLWYVFTLHRWAFLLFVVSPNPYLSRLEVRGATLQQILYEEQSVSGY